MKLFDIVARRAINIEGERVVAGQVIARVEMLAAMTVNTALGGLPAWCTAEESDPVGEGVFEKTLHVENDQPIQRVSSEDSVEPSDGVGPASEPAKESPATSSAATPTKPPTAETNETVLELVEMGLRKAIAERLVQNHDAREHRMFDLLTPEGLQEWIDQGNELTDLDNVGPKYATELAAWINANLP